MAEEYSITPQEKIKQCTKCQIFLPLLCYYKRSGNTGKIYSYCIDCCKKQKADYYQENREEKLAAQAGYYEEHREERCRYAALYRIVNRERYLLSQKFYYDTHKQQRRLAHIAWRLAHNAERRAYDTQYYATHRDERQAYDRNRRGTRRHLQRIYELRWRQQNPDKISVKNQRRLARICGAPLNNLTSTQWNAIKEALKHRCVYCGVEDKNLTMDHLTPVSQYGSTTLHNILPACGSCNSRKQAGPVLKPVQPFLLI